MKLITKKKRPGVCKITKHLPSRIIICFKNKGSRALSSSWISVYSKITEDIPFGRYLLTFAKIQCKLPGNRKKMLIFMRYLHDLFPEIVISYLKETLSPRVLCRNVAISDCQKNQISPKRKYRFTLQWVK